MRAAANGGILIHTTQGPMVLITPTPFYFHVTRKPAIVDALNLQTGAVHGPGMIFWHLAAEFESIGKTN
jgi:hypothetical protein